MGYYSKEKFGISLVPEIQTLAKLTEPSTHYFETENFIGFSEEALQVLSAVHGYQRSHGTFYKNRCLFLVRFPFPWTCVVWCVQFGSCIFRCAVCNFQALWDEWCYIMLKWFIICKHNSTIVLSAIWSLSLMGSNSRNLQHSLDYGIRKLTTPFCAFLCIAGGLPPPHWLVHFIFKNFLM